MHRTPIIIQCNYWENIVRNFSFNCQRNVRFKCKIRVYEMNCVNVWECKNRTYSSPLQAAAARSYGFCHFVSERWSTMVCRSSFRFPAVSRSFFPFSVTWTCWCPCTCSWLFQRDSRSQRPRVVLLPSSDAGTVVAPLPPVDKTIG